jgi:hypothetical protein
MRTASIAEDLVDARVAFHDALGRVDPSSLTTPGLVGEWSAREVVAHLGYWAGHAVDVIHAVEDGRIEEVGMDDLPVEDVNATVARVARETDLATVQAREAASVEALLERLRRMEPSLLDLELPDGMTVEASIREDGPDHYRQHADELRASLDGVQG